MRLRKIVIFLNSLARVIMVYNLRLDTYGRSRSNIVISPLIDLPIIESTVKQYGSLKFDLIKDIGTV